MPVAAAALIAAAFALHVWWLAGVAEDAFITFRFARNLVDGHGFVWNPGEPAVEGYTNFGWLLLSAGFQRLGVDPLLGARISGIAASYAAIFYTWRFGRVHFGWGAQRALVPCAALALSGPFATWAGAGMETNAFAALLIAGAYHLLRGAREGGPGQLWAGCGALLLGVSTRPEGLLVAGVLAAVLLVAGERRAFVRRLAAPALAGAAVFALYTAWRFATFGDLLPNTYHAKTGGGLDQVARGARYAGNFALHFLLPWLPALALGRLGLREPAPRLVTAAVTAVALTYTLAVVALGGDYMAMYRFFVPVLPFIVLLLAHAVPLRPATLAALAFAGAATLLHSTPLEARWLPKPAETHGNWRGVQTERWNVARLSEIGRAFARRASDGESIATPAIGAIGWYSGVTVYGLHGLVDRELARSDEARPVGTGVAGHDRRDWGRLFAREPTWVVLNLALTPSPPQRLGLSSEDEARVRARYALESVWLEDPVNGEAGWFGFLERRD